MSGEEQITGAARPPVKPSGGSGFLNKPTTAEKPKSKKERLQDIKNQLTREDCLLLKQVRDAMPSPKPKEDKEYVNWFQQTADVEFSGAALDSIKQYIKKAQQIGPKEAKSVCTTRVPPVPWSGVWDIHEQKYVGTGDYEGQDRPLENAPGWWKKQGYIDGDRYCDAYGAARTIDALMKMFWYCGRSPKEVLAAIDEAHQELNAWCRRNGKGSVRQRAKRKPFLTGPQTKRHMKHKNNPRGFLVDVIE